MKKWIIANLKLYMNKSETISWAKHVKDGTKDSSNKVVVCPNILFIDQTCEVMKGSKILVGSQNCSTALDGAFTGEISVQSLKEEGAKAVLIGHSERRRFFGETNQGANEKLKVALENGMTAIVCLSGDNKKNFESEIDREVFELLEGVNLEKGKVILAYEPVWAIGTGKSMEPDLVNEVLGFIKTACLKIFGKKIETVYGGSITLETAKEYLERPNVDGLLVGKASKSHEDFIKICNI